MAAAGAREQQPAAGRQARQQTQKTIVSTNLNFRILQIRFEFSLFRLVVATSLLGLSLGAAARLSINMRIPPRARAFKFSRQQTEIEEQKLKAVFFSISPKR